MISTSRKGTGQASNVCLGGSYRLRQAPVSDLAIAGAMPAFHKLRSSHPLRCTIPIGTALVVEFPEANLQSRRPNRDQGGARF